MEIELKATKFSDLETLFDIQIDKKAGYLAAFTPKDPADKVAYFNKYKGFCKTLRLIIKQ